jgi:cobalt-zinc-cadmium resistance protein CzcA
MIDRLIGFSIHNKLIIGLMLLGLIAWGSYALKQLPIDAVPDITNNQVQVITVAPSIAAQEVERLITFPVELTMATIPDIVEIRSFSRFGLSAVTIVFEDDVDVYWARQQVNERLAEAKSQIPKGIGIPEMAPVTTGLGEIYQYVVHAEKGYEDQYSAMELRTIQDWIIKRQLLGTPGVADVSSFGGYLKQYEIAIEPELLRGANISIAEIFTALEKNNQNTGGAYIDKQPNAYFIRSEGMVNSIADIESIIVKTNANGNPVLIRDIAEVKHGSAIRYGASTRNGEGEVVSSIVMMLKGENSAKVIANIKERIAQIEKTLPEGVVIDPFLDRTKLVDNAIGTVATNLTEGALIVIFILILFLGNFRAGLVVASVIPLAMLFAFGMMNLFGVSGNLMSLGAIDFGLIVDGAVIIVESILHRIATNKRSENGEKRLTTKQMNNQVYQAAVKIRSSAAFGEIIILIVYLPILALVGIEGKMFKPMAQTVSFAILGAFILSLTYVPMMSSLVLSKNTEVKLTFSDRMMAFFQRLYQPIIHFALVRKALVLYVVLAVFLLSLFTFANMGGEFIPSLDEGDFAIETRVLTGSSLSETIEASNKASKILLDNFPEVNQVVGKIGSGEIPTDPMPVEACDLMVILKDKDEWVSADNSEELAEKMADALAVIPGVTFGFQQPIQMRFNELMTGARQDVVVKVYGEDLDKLATYANKIGKLVNSVEGATDIYVEQVTGLPQIQVKFNRAAIARYGLNIQDVNTVIESAFAGKSAGVVYEGERRFDLVVRFKESNRKSIDDVSNLYIPTPDGHQIPLNQVATIAFEEGPSQIQRDDTKRRIIVGFNVRNRDVESIVEELKVKVNTQIQFESGYYPTYGGQFQNLIEARERLLIAVPVALLLILTLLYFTFKSVKQSLLIFTAIPLSAIGGVFALYFRGMPFSISAGVGFIALFGVAVLNGIVLIAEFNRLKSEGVTDIKQRVLQGTQLRLRPVLMTAMVASFGFLPMALSNSSGAEVQRPLATVVIGGLFTATFLTLVVLPILYMYFEKGFKRVIKPTQMLFLGMLLIPMVGISQHKAEQNIALARFVELAIKNNPEIEKASQGIEYSEQLQKNTFDIGKTQINWQHGQYNSAVRTDNYFEVSQGFSFPTVYAKKNKVAKANIQGSRIQKAMSINSLIFEVKASYYELIHAKASYMEMEKLDIIYADFSYAANLKYETGESNFLEKTSADAQLAELRNKLKMSAADVEIALTRLKTLLDTQNGLSIDSAFMLIQHTLDVELLNTGVFVNNPQLALLKQQVELQELEQSVKKAELLPDITLGYFNQSLTGSQTLNGVETYYGADTRFTGFQVGIAIPIWAKPQVGKIKAARLVTEMANTALESAELKLNGIYKEAIQDFLKQKNSLTYYETIAVPQANLMLGNAQKAYQEGAVGYYEFVQLVKQSMALKMARIDALKQYNLSAVYLEYLGGNK